MSLPAIKEDFSLQAITARADEYAGDAYAPATVAAYRADLNDFLAFCHEHDLQPFPASVDTVAAYLAGMADLYKTATIQRRLAALSQAHKLAGVDSPTASAKVRRVWKGIKRTKGTAQQQKKAIMLEDLRAMLEHAPETLGGYRDRALLLIGYAGALRRSELVAIDVDHIEKLRGGLLITIPFSKTDQEGEGQSVAIPWGEHVATCPRRALEHWLDAAGIKAGPVFRGVTRWGTVRSGRLSTQSVADVVKTYARAIGLDADEFAGHSLRAGFVTQAAESGAEERHIMEQTRHRSLVELRKYIRRGSAFRNNASAKLGL